MTSQTGGSGGTRIYRSRPERRHQPIEVLHDQVTVGPVRVVVLGDRLLRRVASEHRASEISRQQLRGREHDHAQQDERDQCKAEALGDVAGHPFGWLGGRSQARPPAPSLCEPGLGDTDV